MHHAAHHRPKQTAPFSWTRIPETHGVVLFRLYRRDMRGVLHYELHRFPITTPRAEIACSLLQARKRLREFVDEIDLKIMGVTQ